MPPKKVSAAAPAATQPSRARAAKTATKEAAAKLIANARSSIRKLSPSSKSTSTKSAASKKSTAAPSAASRSTTRTSNLAPASSSSTSKANSAKANSTTSTRKIAKATGASKKKTSAAQADSGKRANISKKRSHKKEDDDDDDDDEEVPKAKKAKANTASKAKAKPNTATAKLLATKAKMPLKEAAPAKAKTNTTTSRKRKVADEEEDEIAPALKKAKTVAAKKAAPKKTAAPKPVVDPITKIKILVQINFAPIDTLDIFVFGEGSAGELGLGARKINGKGPIDIKRPRKNVLLSAPGVGVVQLECGGMHGIVLTQDNKVLTWGVNDQGALGRDTHWDAEMAEAAGYESDDSDDSGLNPRESTPAEIDMTGVAPNTKVVQVAASDSASFAVTEDGRVYGWGTFRGADGIIGFSADVEQQRKPALLTFVSKIVAVACGSNHVLALDNKGKVHTWGAPDQNQLGRRVVERDFKVSALRAGGMRFKRDTRIVKVACGSYHSFALDDQGRLWSWGLNNHGQLGHSAISDGDDDVCVLEPGLVECDQRIIDVAGGEHHSILVTAGGEALVFGRIHTKVLGLPADAYTQENTIYDPAGVPAIVAVPTKLPGLPKIATAAIGTETSYLVTEEGHAYAWGSNCNFQCGVGISEDILFPRRLDNSVVINRKIIFAGAGGQYGMLAAVQNQEAPAQVVNAPVQAEAPPQIDAPVKAEAPAQIDDAPVDAEAPAQIDEALAQEEEEEEL